MGDRLSKTLQQNLDRNAVRLSCRGATGLLETDYGSLLPDRAIHERFW